MKKEVRKSSPKRSLNIRTAAKVKRQIKKALIPGYRKKEKVWNG